MNTQRIVIYEQRMNVLKGNSIHEQITSYVDDYVMDVLRSTVNVDAMPELWNEAELNAALDEKLFTDPVGYITREKLMKWDYEKAVEKITKKVIKEYEKKIESYKAMGIDFDSIERQVLIQTVDRNWREHIDAMDQLRKGISLRAYGQVDPVISYKKEGFDMFDEMIERIQRSTVSKLLKAKLQIVAPPQAAPQPGVIKPTPAPQSAPQQPARAGVRRQMPTPLSAMSSFQTQQKMQQIKEEQDKANGKKED